MSRQLYVTKAEERLIDALEDQETATRLAGLLERATLAQITPTDVLDQIEKLVEAVEAGRSHRQEEF